MATYLFVWNPKRYPLLDFMEEIRAAKVENGILRWSCGSRHDVSAGDRAYLIRLGLAPKGIVAGGTIRCAPFKAPHWDPKKATMGEIASYVDVEKVDPIRDLLPVCPNCHAVIHNQGELRTPEEVRSMLKQAQP